MNWDVFISHASEDKELVARPLAELLRGSGATVWLEQVSVPTLNGATSGLADATGPINRSALPELVTVTICVLSAP